MPVVSVLIAVHNYGGQEAGHADLVVCMLAQSELTAHVPIDGRRGQTTREAGFDTVSGLLRQGRVLAARLAARQIAAAASHAPPLFKWQAGVVGIGLTSRHKPW